MTSDNVIKYLSVLVPLLATTLAVTYDVGFFLGTDIAFFTFFSFTEHLVFALQALPFVAFTVASEAAWLFIIWLLYQLTQDKAAILAQFDEQQRILEEEQQRIFEKEKKRILEQDKKDHTRFFKIIPYAIGVVLVSGLASLISHSYTGALSALFCSVAIWFAPNSIYILTTPIPRAIATAAVGAATLLFAFLLGYDRAYVLVTSKVPTETIYVDDKSIPVRLIRSGDKGVLFYSLDSKKVRLIRWEAIKSIEAI